MCRKGVPSEVFNPSSSVSLDPSSDAFENTWEHHCSGVTFRTRLLCAMEEHGLSFFVKS